MIQIPLPSAETVTTLAGGGLLVKLLDWWASARKIKAEAGKIDADAVKVLAEAGDVGASAAVKVGAEYQKIVDMLRGEMAARDARCQEEIDALHNEIRQVKDALAARDKIIVALVYRRAMDNEARALLLQIAPAAEPLPKDDHFAQGGAQ